MLIKLYARDNEHLMRLLNDRIQMIPGVTGTETPISPDHAQTAKFRSILTLPIRQPKNKLREDDRIRSASGFRSAAGQVDRDYPPSGMGGGIL